MWRRLIALAAAGLALATPAAAAETGGDGPALWRLDCGEFTIPDYNAFFSDTFAYPPGPKTIVVSCYLIRHQGRYLLWDAGLPGELVGNPQGGASLRRRIVDQLRDIGVAPADVAMLAVSHYHFDHIGQAADFAGAQLVIGAGDLDVLRGEPGPFIQPERLRPWLEGGAPTRLARGDTDLFGDGKVVMLSMPGHTPGHYALLVRLASGPVLLSGDLYHFTEQVERRGVPPFNHNRADTLASMDRYEAIARNLGARTIIQHEPADVAKLPAFPQAAR
jgi:N-acyl homoserine lactone hydrolase